METKSGIQILSASENLSPFSYLTYYSLGNQLCEKDTERRLAKCAPTLSVLQGFSMVSEISGTIGSRLVISCSVDPIPPTTPVDTYIWQRDGVDFILGLSEIAFDPLQASDGGSYRCGVLLDTTNCHGQTIFSPEIDINTPPEITALTGPTTVTEGQTLELTCDADGWPVPTIQWLHPNGSLLGMETTYSNPSVGQSDGGDYTCQASNSQGMVSQPITITVEGPPEVISVAGPTSVEKGGTLELTCTATGSPLPTIQWFHPNGSLVGMEAVYTDIFFGPSDAGNYTCVASNSRGTAMQAFTVTLGGNSVTVFQHTLPPGLQGNGGCHNIFNTSVGNICNAGTFDGPSALVDGSMTTFFCVDGSGDNVTIAFALSLINPPSLAQVELFLLTCPGSESTNVILYQSSNFNSGSVTLLVNAADVPCNTAQNVILCTQPPVERSAFYLLEFTSAAIKVAEVQFFSNTPSSSSPPPVLATPTTGSPPILATPTTSSPPGLTTPSTSLPPVLANNAVIGGAVGGLLGGILVILVLAVTVVAVIRRRREKAHIQDYYDYIGPPKLPRPQVIITSSNVAYTSSIEVQSMRNAALANAIPTQANAAYASSLEMQP